MKSLTSAFNAWQFARNTKREQRALTILGTTSPHHVQNGPRSQRRQIQRAIHTLQRNYGHAVRNWYESGNPYTDGTRSFVGNYSMDARYDQNPVTRTTMEIRCRYWEQNSDLMKSALDVSSQYVIGTHMPVVTSLASDTDWQSRAETVFQEMCADAGLNCESMFAILDVAHRRKKVDGNILALETYKPGEVIIRRGTKYETVLNVLKPCYQLIESQRIGTPMDSWADNSSNVVDGVQYKEIETKLADGTTRKQMVKAGYWVNDAPSTMGAQQNFIFIPIEKSYYCASAHRVNEPRSVSDFYASEPTLALLEDLLKLEMRAQEVQSDLTLFITNGAGQIVDPKMQNTLGALGVRVSTGTDGKPVVTAKEIEQVKAVYEKIWGGRTAVGRTNDTLQFLAPNRPAEATLNLWNFLIDSFCVGSNVPRILVFPKTNKGQGTEVRAELERANAGWHKEFNLVWKPFVLRAWKYFIGWAIKNDERLKNPPVDWNQVEVSPPRSVVVDLGYESANDLANLAAGTTNLHTIAQKLGTTKNKLIQQSVSDLYDIKLACAKMADRPEYKQFAITVEAAEVRNNLSDVLKNLAAKSAAEAQLAAAENAQELEPALA